MESNQINIIFRHRCAGKILPARKAHPLPQPHRETTPTQMSPYKLSPQLRLQKLSLALLCSTALQSLCR
eukprot:UN26986